MSSRESQRSPPAVPSEISQPFFPEVRNERKSDRAEDAKALSAKAAALYASLAEHLLDGVEKRRIVAAVNDFLDAGVDDELGAGEAGGDRDVDRGARDVHPVTRRLADCVLLGMYAQALV